MKAEKITDMEYIRDMQRYLIGGFIHDGGADKYNDVLPPGLFGIYAPLFSFISTNPRLIDTPEYYEICRKIGGKEIIDAMSSWTPIFSLEVGKYIHRLWDFYVESKLLKENSPMEVFEMTREIYEKIENIRIGTQGGVEKIDGLILSLQDDIEDAIENGDKAHGYSTGIPTLDKYTGGLVKGRSIRLSAYSNTGKSALSYFVCNNALRQGAKVLYLSLEITKEELRNRLLSNWYKTPMWKFEKKSLLKDFDMSGYTKNQIYVSHGVNDISEIEKIARSVKPDILIIDYVQLIRSNEESEYERLTSIARRIQSLTLELNMATFDLSQVSNDGKQYRKGDIIPAKGSGELIAAANVALVMKASEFPGRIELHIAKNRHGQKDKCIDLVPNFQICDFEDCGETEPTEGKKKF